MSKTPTIKEAVKNGIQLSVSLAQPGGSLTLPITDNDVPSYIADKESFAARYFGLTLEEYQIWIEWDGAVRCGGYTAKKKRCRNVVATPMQLSPKAWLNLQGEYCVHHGGPCREKILRKIAEFQCQ